MQTYTNTQQIGLCRLNEDKPMHLQTVDNKIIH